MKNFDIWSSFYGSIQATELVYDVTMYGQRHREIRLVQLLEKFGDSRAKLRNNTDMESAIKEIEAMERGQNSKLISLDLDKKQIVLVRKVVRDHLRTVRSIPKMARNQLTITLAAQIEGYVSDMLRQIFLSKPDTLKSRRQSLKDDELVDSIKLGDPLLVLAEKRIREIMYSSAREWIYVFQKELGIDISNPDLLVEIFLIRNCMLHNNEKIGPDLKKTSNKRYKNVGKKINITERDVVRFIDGAKEFGSDLYAGYNSKFI
ncbi:MAG: hypothetical protein Kilf2KO_31360 [Rhodospirillales bacterium]